MKTVVLAMLFGCVVHSPARGGRNRGTLRPRPPIWMVVWVGGPRGLRRLAITKRSASRATLPCRMLWRGLRFVPRSVSNAPSANERKFLDNLTKRVSLWAEVDAVL